MWVYYEVLDRPKRIPTVLIGYKLINHMIARSSWSCNCMAARFGFCRKYVVYVIQVEGRW